MTASNKLAQPARMAVALGCFSALLSFGGCLTAPAPEPNVTHIVLIWLKHPHRAADRAELVRAAHSLRRIPGVVGVETGRALPVLQPYRARDFDLGVVITFRDRSALQRYEADPSHREALRRYLEPLVRQYETYNLINR